MSTQQRVLSLMGVVLIVVVGLAVTACDPLWPGDPGPPGATTTTTGAPSQVDPYAGSGPKVAVAGDSITDQSKPSINAALQAAGFSSSVFGLSGGTLYDGRPHIDLYVPTAPAVMIEEFGFNDESRTFAGTDQTYTVQNFLLRLLSLRATFNASCFVPTTVTTHLSEAEHGNAAARNAIGAAFDANIRSYYPIYVDWDALSFAHPEYLQADEIHPNDLGRAALADADVAAAQACVAATPTPTP